MKQVLSLLFKIGKRKSTLEETVIEIQNGNQQLQNKLIDDYKPFIAKNVSAVCKRYINESDDEFSIGLIAFNEAIEKYSKEKGSSFLSFSELLIKRRVIDYIRKEARVRNINFISNGETDEEGAQSKLEAHLSVDDYQRKVEQEQRKEEILHFHKVLQEFGLSFQELLEISPKHADARQNAIMVSKAVVENEELMETLFEKKHLPIKQLESKVSVSRKTIERNRKYIIAMAIILSSEYVYLKDYLKGVLES
ncbi:RNA polymerase sigma factor SigI [Fredinandcohnia onubensis]|uniref:RNA polymerase sigma factor SigI n=1 Tax=Fredinandcohnia onubensis TaxID=1571209 RepID=UPI000C0BBFE5|nr:RNA polymerase sigma factor SigI [Fredinandcohnia onubensis]